MDDLQVPVIKADGDLAHIAEEMYKKNHELAEKNRLLLLLQKIEEIILNSVTDIHQVAQNVVDISAATEGFLGIAIYLYEKENNLLKFLVVSKTETVEKYSTLLMGKLYPPVIELKDPESPAEKAISTKSKQAFFFTKHILEPYFKDDEIRKMLELNLVKSTLIYPLIVRGDLIGVIFFNLNKPEETLSEFQMILIERLVDIVGIAIDNSLLYQKIKIANIQLQQLDKAKDEFFSIASHELRTPLTAIQGNSSMIMDYFGDNISDPNMKEMIGDIHVSSVRLIKIVNEFLDMSRLEQGKMVFVSKSVDLPDLIRGVIKEQKSLADTKQTEIVYEGPQSRFVSCDPDRVTQVLINLLSNAVKNTEKGKIIIKFEEDDKFASVTVSDNGSGISPLNQRNLFMKFRQANSDFLTHDAAAGAGLGLYISKLLIENMGGTIRLVSSEEGRGATFMFKIPISPFAKTINGS